MLYAARTVVVCGVLAQLAGFAKLLVVAAYFGAGPVLDAYYLGLVIPTFLIGLSSAILQTTFIPTYIGAKARNETYLIGKMRNVTLTWTVVILASIALSFAALQRPTTHLLQGNGGVAGNPLRAAFVPLMFSAPLNGLADAIGLLMNAEGRFGVAAIAPLLSALVSTLILIFWPSGGIEALVWSLLLGLLAQVALLWAGLRRMGIHLRPAFIFPGALPRSILGATLPVLISSALGNSILAFLQVASARAGPGGVSAFGYASRLHNAVVQPIVMSVSVVLLPHFALLIAERKDAELRSTLGRVFAATLLFSLGGLAFVAAGGAATVNMLLQRGHFTRADGSMVAAIWLALTGGLFGTTWGMFLARFFQAQKRPWTIANLAIVSVLANVGLTFLLLPRYGVAGIALANSVAYTIIASLFHRLASQSLGPLLDRRARRFAVGSLLINLVAYGAAVAWAELLRGSMLPIVIAGQFLIIASANMLFARASPLNISVRGLLTAGWH